MVPPMIQLSFLVPASPPPPPPPAPMRLEPHPHGVRVTGVWDAPLAAARATLGRWLASLPADAPVVDLLLGLEQPAAEAAARLAAPPTPTNALSARHCVIAGRPWLRLFGLYQLQRADLVVALAPDADLAAGYELLTRLGAAHLARPTPLPRDRPLPFGYWLIGFGDADLADDATWDLLRDGLGSGHLADAFDDRMATPAPALVIEADDVTWAEPDRWLVGASRAVRTWAAQRRAAARLGLGPLRDVPNAHDAAIACPRVHEMGELGESDDFFAYREPPQSELDSGWRFGCLDPGHVHDPSTTRIIQLKRVVARVPGLAQYVGLPPGWVVTREDGGWWLTAPDDPRSFLDPEGGDAPPWPDPAETAP